MGAYNYKFTDNEIKDLETHRNNQKDLRLKIRIIAILLLASDNLELSSQNFEFAASILGIVSRTIKNWFRKYQADGIHGLISCSYKPKKPKLTFQQINQVIIWVSYTPKGHKLSFF